MSITPEKELLPKIYVEQLLKSIKRGERLDGRGLLDYRPITVILNPINKAEGSALVKLGRTQVITGVKAELGSPFKDAPDEGVLQVNVEFVPLASPSFEPGPPNEHAIEVARIIDRSLREPRIIKLDELIVEPGKTVWTIYNDIYLIDYDGNIVDASMLASILALVNTRLPVLIETEEGYQLDKSRKETPLPISMLAVTVTMGIIGDTIIVDPTLDEETISDAILTIAIDENERICGIQKSGEKGISKSILNKAINIAFDKGKWLINYTRNILNNPQEYIKPLSEWGA